MSTTEVLEDVTAAAKAQLAVGVTAAYAQEGYVDSEGERDLGLAAEAAFTVVTKTPVPSYGARETDAPTRGAIVAEVFPSLAKTPDEWNASSDPALAVKIYGEIKKQVWDLLKPDKTGKVQQLVGLRMPGFVLCRTKIGVDHIDAAYVTEDAGCITKDFVTPLNASVVRSHKAMGRNMAMVVQRKPDAAAKWERLYKDAAKSGLTAGHDPIKLAIEAARDNGAAPDVDPAE